MDFSGSKPVDIFEIYRTYYGILSRNGHANPKEALAQLSKFVESRGQLGNTIFNELFELMSHLHLTVDACQFACFYNFVFFMCCENGQKSITVSRAIAAWRLVLIGRFRLLNQWCDFVEKHQQYNISEDTWQQVLTFCCRVLEDLEGYDSKGAWPVLIDDFVDHMYRLKQSNGYFAQNFLCDPGDPEAQSSIPDGVLSGLGMFPGVKRKSLTYEVKLPNPANLTTSEPLHISKRSRQIPLIDESMHWEVNPSGNDVENHMEVVQHGSPLGSLNNSSACAAEGNLSKGFSGLLSTGSFLQFDQKRRVS